MLNRLQLMKNCSTLYRLFQNYYSDCFEAYGLGAGQHYFLEEIGKNPGVSMAELADEGAYDSGTVTRAIRRLCDSGYVFMLPDETDHRVKRLLLTPKGVDMASIVSRERNALFKRITVDFTEEELLKTGDYLNRLANNLIDVQGVHAVHHAHQADHHYAVDRHDLRRDS